MLRLLYYINYEKAREDRFCGHKNRYNVKKLDGFMDNMMKK